MKYIYNGSVIQEEYVANGWICLPIAKTLHGIWPTRIG